MGRDYPGLCCPRASTRHHLGARWASLVYFLLRDTVLSVVLVAGFLTALTATLRLALAGGTAAGLMAAPLGVSPSTDLTGQILNRGHFWQPTARAIGQIVMMGWWVEGKNQSAVSPSQRNVQVDIQKAVMPGCHTGPRPGIHEFGMHGLRIGVRNDSLLRNDSFLAHNDSFLARNDRLLSSFGVALKP